MMKHDFSDLTPPINLWDGTTQNQKDCIFAAARWGAEQAAERLANQWPEPITDRPPTEADGDADGYVQMLVDDLWSIYRWQQTVKSWANGRPIAWLHTPRWQPPAPPTLKEQALKALEDLSDESDGYLQHRLAIIRRALEADS